MKNQELAQQFLNKGSAEYIYHTWKEINELKTKEAFSKAFQELVEGRVEFLRKLDSEDEEFCWKEFELFFDSFCDKYSITNDNRRNIKRMFFNFNDYAVRKYENDFAFPDSKFRYRSYHPFWNSNLEIKDKMEKIVFERRINN